MKQKLMNYCKISGVIMSSFLSTVVICSKLLGYNGNNNFSYTNGIVCICIFILLLYLFPRVVKGNNRRCNITILIISSIFSLFEVFGSQIDQYENLRHLNFNSILVFVGIECIFYLVISIIYQFIDNILILRKTTEQNKTSLKCFFIFCLVIFVSYIPYFLANYPGILSPDSVDQLNQALNKSLLTNHHPVTHTMLIKLMVKLGMTIKDLSLGVALYSTLQMLIVSVTFGYSVYYMKKNGLKNIFVLICLAFYALYPVHPLYSISMWKDILFAMTMLLLTLALTDIVSNSERFFKSKLKCTLLSLIILLTMLFRNNGLYVILIVFVGACIINRKYLKKIIITFMLPLIIYFVFTGPIFNLLKIRSGSVVEALSIPLQQFARISKECADTLTSSEKETIHNFIPVENLGNLYNSKLSDPVKSRASSKYIDENKGQLVITYFRFALKYPLQTLEAFACNNYGYWYPEALNWVTLRGINGDFKDDIKVSWDSKLNSSIINEISDITNSRNTPIISMLFSIGAMMWVVLILFAYCIYRKKYSIVLIYIPIFALWLTNLASPVFCEYRYMYSLFTCLPTIIFSLNICNLKKEEV